MEGWWQSTDSFAFWWDEHAVAVSASRSINPRNLEGSGGREVIISFVSWSRQKKIYTIGSSEQILVYCFQKLGPE